jgi:SAM-dependent methyltransferase
MIELREFYETVVKDEFKRDPDVVRRYTNRIEKAAKLLKDGLTLDIGCRSGYMNKYVKGQYIGLDITEVHFKEKFTGIVADACHLPFRNNVFDNVICMELLEHLVFPNECLAEMYRVMKYGGILIVSVPNIVCLVSRAKVLLGMEPINYDFESMHLHPFTYNSLEKLLRESGFFIEHFEPLYTSIPPRRIFKNFYRLSTFLARCFPKLNDILLVACRKNEGLFGKD